MSMPIVLWLIHNLYIKLIHIDTIPLKVSNLIPIIFQIQLHPNHKSALISNPSYLN